MGSRKLNGGSRNWLDLPPDVMSSIFQKVGVIDIIVSAQWVCSAWRKLSKEPHLFRFIDTEKWEDLFDGESSGMEKLVREAVDRSCGQVIELTMDGYATDGLLKYISRRLGSLRRLRLVNCDLVTCGTFIQMVRRLPLLEELELCYCPLRSDVFEAVGRLCPQLKSFQLNYCTYSDYTTYDEVAVAIGKNMKELRRLNLFGDKLTDEGLRAILDGCLHLQSLDLRRCFNVTLPGDLDRQCAHRNIKVKRPEDPTDDYGYDIFTTSEEDSDELDFGFGDYFDEEAFLDGFDYTSAESLYEDNDTIFFDPDDM